jgi:predicted nucleic acid-binding protein
MNDRIFIDTNILLYAYDLDAGLKRDVASNIVRRVWAEGTGTLSTQVLQEFYVNVTMKIARPISPCEARGIIGRYLVWHVEVNTPESVLRASEIQERYQLSFWDALIIAAAAKARAAILYAEDLNNGQMIEGIRIINPFLAPTSA